MFENEVPSSPPGRRSALIRNQHGRKKIAVSVTPELVQILLQLRKRSFTSVHTSVDGVRSDFREAGDRDGDGRNQLTLSITRNPPGRSLSKTLNAQKSR